MTIFSLNQHYIEAQACFAVIERKYKRFKRIDAMDLDNAIAELQEIKRIALTPKPIAAEELDNVMAGP